MTFNPVEILNVVDDEYQNKIYHALTDIKFPWHFLEDTTHEYANDTVNSTPGFANLIFHPENESNPYLEFFTPLIDEILKKSNLKLTSLIRVRAGFLLNTKYVLPSLPYKYNEPHKDCEYDHYTAIYYVNDADGDTVIFYETEKAQNYRPMHKSRPDKGKVLLFNGQHYHASTCPKMCTKRIAITINFTAILNE